MKNLTTARRIELAIYPTLASLLDGTLTLTGQPDSYFDGDFATAEELNPIGYLALSTSPWLFGFGLLVWIFVFCSVLFFCRELMSTRISLVITALHILGAATWLLRTRFGILWVILLFSLFRFLIFPRLFPTAKEKETNLDA